MRIKSRLLIVASALACLGGLAHGQTEPKSVATLQLVFVLDGLRPDSITEAQTPNLYRLRKGGVTFENTHAVFPTVTRVNSSSLATGSYPARHGIMGNSIYVPVVDPLRAFNNDDFQRLVKLDEATSGRMVTATGIAELLERSGRKMVVVSSGSTGSAMLLAPKTQGGIGTVINGDFFPGKKVAYPDAVSETILKRFGPAPIKAGHTDRYDASVDWSMAVLLDYVLPELKPSVAFVWMAEPDHIEHGLGVGAPESLAAIRNDDRQIGLVLKKLEALGVRDKTNIMVVSDHGFAQTVYDVNVGKALTDAGLIGPVEAGEVVIASSGQAVALHVKNRDPKRVQAIVEFLQRQPWIGVLFTAAKRGGPAHEGAIAGTFALEYAHLGGHERGADVVFTFPWSSAPNQYGVPGTEYNLVIGNKSSGAVDKGEGNHRGIGPWTVRNTMLANGPDFKRGAVVRTPTSNVDVAPTLLHLRGMSNAASEMDGRALMEALVSGPDQEKVAMETRSLRVRSGGYSAILQVSDVAGKRYIDKAWRDQ